MGVPPWGAHRPGVAARAILFLARRTPLGRGKARRLMLSAFASLHDGPADVRLFGAPARLHPADNHAERRALINPDRYDRPERDFVIDGLGRENAIYVDIGANFGLYVLDVLLRAPRARILAVEPHADASVRALAGDGAGDPVAVRPLLAMLADAGIDRIDVLKIDIEGWEDEALGPFAQMAPAALLPRRIVIEHALRRAWRTDCIAQLEARGYRISGRTRANTLLQLD